MGLGQTQTGLQGPRKERLTNWGWLTSETHNESLFLQVVSKVDILGHNA
jgi:hypothetical protein